MTDSKTISIAFMQPPFESSRSTTVFRLINMALTRSIHVKVFAYEGAVAQAFKPQKAHANNVHGRSEAAENHPLPRLWISELFALARSHGVELTWVNCGLCVDERGVGDTVDGVARGSPADFMKMIESSDNTIVVGIA